MTGGIYAIRHVETGRAYIGSALSFEKRWQKHRLSLRHNEHFNRHLQYAWNKYSESAFRFEILEVVQDKNSLILREQFYIDLCRAANTRYGFNLSPTAGGTMGVKFTEESRQRLSRAKKGTKYRPMSAEGRKNLSEAFTGKKKSKEHRLKISAALKGRRPSDNTIKGSKAYWTGRKKSPEVIEHLSRVLRGRARSDVQDHLARMAKRRMFTLEVEKLIINDRESGMSLSALARKYCCSVMPIRRILKNHSEDMS